jgi:ABC-type transport system substrate-binding protein
MKEKTSLLAVFIIASMLAMVIIPTAHAWEYWDTHLIPGNPPTNSQEDTLVDYSGPHADRIQIRLFSNELTEFQALESGQLDMTDWPIDKTHYTAWTTPPLDADIAVVNTGPEFGMFILDMRMDDRVNIAPGVPNPARTAPFGNPMADVWLRRAIACVVDRKQTVEQIVSGGSPPWLGEAMYTPLDSAYGSWQHPQLNPTSALAAYAYVNPDGSANIAKGNQYLDDHGYLPIVGGKRTKGGVPFTLQFYYRTDHTYRNDFATIVMQPNLAALGLDVQMIGVTSAGGRAQVMDAKKGHMYTGGWGLTSDPDHLYYLFHINNYWHPGRPPNYMYYPGDANTFLAPYDDYSYCNTAPGHADWGHDLHTEYAAPDLNFTDPVKTYDEGDELWENPQNYWSWEMMISTTYDRALFCAYKSQEAIAYLVCGVPVWASASYTAFHRRYVGTPGVPDAEDQWEGQPWKGVVNQKGLGVWGTFSFYDMHPANALYGDGSHMTIRWGFRQPTMSLNPIYAEWVWDWYVLNQAYDSLIGLNPYTLQDNGWLASSWELSTWDSPDYGTCTKVTFNLRHDVVWSDGMPLTSSDVKFTWGGPYVTGSLSNLLQKKGYPPAYWSSQVADILSVATPDAWTVICYLDVYAYFGLHSMSGFNIVLPEHIWKPIIETGDPTQPWNQPCVVTSGYIIDSTADPAPVGYIMLHKNPLHFHVDETSYPKTQPINIRTYQFGYQPGDPGLPTAGVGQTHWIFPRQGQTGISYLHFGVWIHSKYAFEWGPYKTDVFPLTNLTGYKTVELWIWNGVGSPSQESNYVKYRDSTTDPGVLVTNKPFNIPRCVPYEEHFDLPNIPAWYYYIKVTLNITDCHIFNGVEWVDVTDNPNFYSKGMIETYREHIVTTSRYDIGGLLWKPAPPATPKYQPAADLKVNVKDTYACGQAFGSRPGYPNWNTAADVNTDYKVDVKDYYAISQNFGWVAPNPLGP